MRFSNIIISITIVTAFLITGFSWVPSLLDINGMNSDQTILGNKTPELTGNVTIGLLLPLSGDLSSHGNENLIAAKLAEDDFNTYLKEMDEPWQLKLQLKNSATSPILANEEINFFYKHNVTTIIGLESSENISYVLDNNSNKDKMLFLSCCSSAPGLAISNDNVFRMVPDDRNQGSALAKLLEEQGIKVIIPIWRDDIWGNGLQKEILESFNKTGKVDGGFIYYPNSINSVNLTHLNNTVANYAAEYKEEEIGVLFLGFGEISYLMESMMALDNSMLDKICWFGPGAITKDRQLEKSDFAKTINLTTVQISPAKNLKYEYVKNFTTVALGADPNSFVYPSYDVVWVLGEAFLQSGSSDVSEIKNNLNYALESPRYSSAIDKNSFNNYGDPNQANYTIWKFDGEWNELGEYFTFNDTIKFHKDVAG